MTRVAPAVTGRDPTLPDIAGTGGADAAERENRGRTVIAERVVERIAARAATEAGAVVGPGAGLPGLRGPAERPRVTVSIRGRLAAVRVALGITYPAPVRATTRAVRDGVRARVGELTGIDVRQVDIAVARLPAAAAEGRRVR